MTFFLLNCSAGEQGWVFFPSDHQAFHYLGRFDQLKRSSFPGTRIDFSFVGTGVKIHLSHFEEQKNYYEVILDDTNHQVLGAHKDSLSYLLWDSLAYKEHHVTVFRRTEPFVGIDQFFGVEIENGKLIEKAVEEKKMIVFFGNSITCGYGNEVAVYEPENTSFNPENENHYQSYAAKTARMLDAVHYSISYSGKGVYRNFYGDTVETMLWFYNKVNPFSGEPDVWDFPENPNLVVLNLGTNDFYMTAPPKDKFVKKYVELVKLLKTEYGNIPFICALGPMLSDDYPPEAQLWSKAKAYLREVKKQLNSSGIDNVDLFFFAPQQPPFGENYHPTIATHQKMADTLSAFIQQQYKW